MNDQTTEQRLERLESDMARALGFMETFAANFKLVEANREIFQEAVNKLGENDRMLLGAIRGLQVLAGLTDAPPEEKVH